MISFFYTKYINDDGGKNLKIYKYSGSDASLLYKFVLSPTAQMLVDKVFPDWLAPNLVFPIQLFDLKITLCGFLFTVIPHIIIYLNDPDEIGGNVPGWEFIFAGFLVFCYMIFDNADGKQARKTGSSSPLGLLFDHGCDAMGTFVTGINFFVALQLGNSLLSLIAFIVAMTVFFMGTWEEYYVESLDLPCFNGADEGLMGIILIMIFTGIVGNNFWVSMIGNWYAYEIVVLCFVILSGLTILMNIYNVYKKTPQKMFSALSKLITLLYITATLLIANYLSISNIVLRKCRFLIYFAGFSFAKLVGLLQATHCAHIEFNPFILTIYIPASLMNINTSYGYFSGDTFISEDQLLFICVLSAFLGIQIILNQSQAYIHFVLSIIGQFTRVLKIRVFKIKASSKEQSLL